MPSERVIDGVREWNKLLGQMDYRAADAIVNAAVLIGQAQAYLSVLCPEAFARKEPKDAPKT